MPQNQDENRSEERVATIFRGTLTHDGASFPCAIQNMCSRGFLIKQSSNLPVGQVLRLKCDLYPDQSVECTVQVRHVNANCLGARVVEISDDDRQLCLQFLEEQRAANSPPPANPSAAA